VNEKPCFHSVHLRVEKMMEESRTDRARTIREAAQKV
jgi:hypothetical protein